MSAIKARTWRQRGTLTSIRARHMMRKVYPTLFSRRASLITDIEECLNIIDELAKEVGEKK